MSYRLYTLHLDGVRGINQPISIEMDKQLTIFYGPNGSGKTSILNSIQWGITGDLPHMRGGDFTKEDAITNSFTLSNNANAKLQFTGPDTFSITRNKKRSKSTRGGGKTFVLEAGREFIGDSAIVEVESRFGLELGDISKGKFLSQESIREALSYTPKARSAFIEKILGTYEIKEFAQILAKGPIFNRPLDKLDNQITSIRKSKENYIINLKKDLDKKGEKIFGDGFERKLLNKNKINLDIQTIINKVIDLANIYNIDCEDFSQQVTNSEEVRLLLEKLTRFINELDRARLIKKQEKENGLNEIHKMKRDCDLLRNLIHTHRGQKKEAELERLSLLSHDIDQKKKEIEKLDRKISILPSLMNLLQQQNRALSEEKDSIDNISSTYGTITQISGRIKNNELEAEKLRKALESYSNHIQIINQSIELIESTGEKTCPVCNQSIRPTQLIQSLQGSLSKDILIQINTTRGKLEEIKNILLENNEAAHSLRIKRESLKMLKNSCNDTIQEIENLLGYSFDIDELNNLLLQMKKDRLNLQNITEKMHIEKNEVNESLITIEKIQKKQEFVQYESQRVLNRTFDELDDLILACNIVEKENNEIIDELNDSRKINQIRKDLDSIEKMNEYLSEKEFLQKKEREFDDYKDEITDLETKKNEILDLRKKVNKIRELLMKYQKIASENQINDLETKMNEYYRDLVAHPYYDQLRIIIEKLDPLQFSFRITGIDQESYLATRLSTAQLNGVALSIFLANSSLIVGNLPLIVIDDPTQNMDEEHKEAFARLISSLVSEFQVILATEDRQTVDYLNEYNDGRMYTLNKWSTDGIWIDE